MIIPLTLTNQPVPRWPDWGQYPEQPSRYHTVLGEHRYLLYVPRPPDRNGAFFVTKAESVAGRLAYHTRLLQRLTFTGSVRARKRQRRRIMADLPAYALLDQL